MKRYIIFFAIAVSVIFVTASATIINVPDDYETIQEGIDASTDGDTVLVQPGTYVENINFNGHNIALGSKFLTTEDTTYISSTVIDGDSSGIVVTFENGEDNSALITGFTIKNGAAFGGGGVLCSSSSPAIRNNIILENLAVFGGGIYCRYSSAIITNNTIEDNRADTPDPETYLGHGGGIYCEYSNPLIRNNIIRGNWVFVRGAGIYCGFSSNPSIDNNMILNNTANINGGGGGGICLLDASNAVITNNIISGNFAYSAGGGIYIYRSDPVIESNVISFDSTYFRGAGIRCRDSNAYIYNNVIESNAAIGYRGWGGGIYCDDSNPEIVNNLIIRNISDATSEGRGGGIYCDDSNPQIINNSIIGNFTDSYWRGGLGGGIYCQSSNPVITNCTISGNTAVYGGGGGIYIVESIVIMMNTILWDDSSEYTPEIRKDMSSTLEITYCDVDGGWDGEGNIDCDPMFCDPENNDFYLNIASCCAGAGEGGVDIGAFGVACNGCFYIPGDCNHNGVPLELQDALIIVGIYRGDVDPYYTCDCPPHGSDFAPEADPNGNCIPFEIGDVVTEISAYRGAESVSGCEDCPGSLRLVPNMESQGRLR